jgi:recombination protein RecR
MFSPLVERLIRSLKVLPGVGAKTAQRMAIHLLERNREGGAALALAIQEALENVGHCQVCRMFCETGLCSVCAHPGRDKTLMCIVESPADMLAIEQSGRFAGRYFVLFGHLSPIDGIGPDEIGLPLLQRHLAGGEVAEIILATGTTVEGEATAYYIQELAKSSSVAVSRIAHGVPVGGDLEYMDANTLGLALSGRHKL